MYNCIHKYEKTKTQPIFTQAKQLYPYWDRSVSYRIHIVFADNHYDLETSRGTDNKFFNGSDYQLLWK